MVRNSASESSAVCSLSAMLTHPGTLSLASTVAWCGGEQRVWGQFDSFRLSPRQYSTSTSRLRLSISGRPTLEPFSSPRRHRTGTRGSFSCCARRPSALSAVDELSRSLCVSTSSFLEISVFLHMTVGFLMVLCGEPILRCLRITTKTRLCFEKPSNISTATLR